MTDGPIVLALEGHDGAGKTTLAARLADALGGRHVRPFAGTAGELMLWSALRGDAAFARDLARRAIDRARDVNRDARVLVFDRHWMTISTLLPEAMWDAWAPRPPTALLLASLDATLARLGARDEPPETVASHARYLALYEQLAARYGAVVVRTDDADPDACLVRLVAWARPLTG